MSLPVATETARDAVVRTVESGLAEIGLSNLGQIYSNLVTPALYEQVVRRREGVLSYQGPIVVRTGHHTGRSANDKFIAEDDVSRDTVWWGPSNRPFSGSKTRASKLKTDSSPTLFHRTTPSIVSRGCQVCFVGAISISS